VEAYLSVWTVLFRPFTVLLRRAVFRPLQIVALTLWRLPQSIRAYVARFSTFVGATSALIRPIGFAFRFVFGAIDTTCSIGLFAVCAGAYGLAFSLAAPASFYFAGAIVAALVCQVGSVRLKELSQAGPVGRVGQGNVRIPFRPANVLLRVGQGVAEELQDTSSWASIGLLFLLGCQAYLNFFHDIGPESVGAIEAGIIDSAGALRQVFTQRNGLIGLSIAIALAVAIGSFKPVRAAVRLKRVMSGVLIALSALTSFTFVTGQSIENRRDQLIAAAIRETRTALDQIAQARARTVALQMIPAQLALLQGDKRKDFVDELRALQMFAQQTCAVERAVFVQTYMKNLDTPHSDLSTRAAEREEGLRLAYKYCSWQLVVAHALVQSIAAAPQTASERGASDHITADAFGNADSVTLQAIHSGTVTEDMRFLPLQKVEGRASILNRSVQEWRRSLADLLAHYLASVFPHADGPWSYVTEALSDSISNQLLAHAPSKTILEWSALRTRPTGLFVPAGGTENLPKPQFEFRSLRTSFHVDPRLPIGKALAHIFEHVQMDLHRNELPASSTRAGKLASDLKDAQRAEEAGAEAARAAEDAAKAARETEDAVRTFARMLEFLR